MRREGGQQVLRVVLDRPGPAATAEESVSIADCERVSQELGTILDVEDLVARALTRWRSRRRVSIDRSGTPTTIGGSRGGSRRS